jgi:hypothetical protein
VRVGERSDLVVPRRRVAVELCLGGQAARRVELFLGEHRDHDWTRQEVSDLLEGGRQLLPCRDLELGTCTLINRDHIVWLSMPLSEDHTQVGDDSELGLLFDQRHQVSLHLTGGIRLDGAVLYSAPVEQARLADHVNQAGSFLALYLGEQVVLVRKSAVLEIIEK